MTDIEIVEDDVSDLDSPLPGLWVTPPVVLPPPPPPPPRPPIKQPTSPFQLPSNAMYGFLGEHAETLDGPLNWTYPALVTVYASTRILTPANVRPTLYTVLVGPPQDGKSTSQDRALQSLGLVGSAHIHEATPSSDRGLELLLADPETEKDKTGAPIFKPTLSSTIVMDEFRNLLSKLDIHGSGTSLASALCTLFYKDKVSSPVKGSKAEINASISILGAFACADRDEFAEKFGAETMGGLYSRCLICPGPAGWKWSSLWRPKVVLRRPKTRSVTVPDAIVHMAEDWRDAEPAKKRGRLAEIALRVALITSSANHDDEVTAECMQAAIFFMEWQERIKSVYTASTAQNDDAKITCAVLDAMAEAEAECEEGDTARWVKWSGIARAKNWQRKWGATNVSRVKKALIDDRLIEVRYEQNDDGTPDYKNPTGWVRLHG